ncbi:transferase family-domain-containing protein [Nemania serpens]|nr:transferase family-domain-containing protein [Nemania serpens]
MDSKQSTTLRDSEDVVGQFPQLKTFNHALLLFPLAENITDVTVVQALKQAVSDVIKHVPWLGEQVVHEDRGEGSSGVFKTVPMAVENIEDVIIYTKDCRALCPSYAEIVEAGGPFSMLDGNILCPFPGFPLSYDGAITGPVPVVAIQANFIQDGLLLNFSNQHNMMDATGTFNFLLLLSFVLQGKKIPQAYIDQANTNRGDVIPLLGPDEPILDHAHLLKPPIPRSVIAAGMAKLGPAKWAVFRIKPEIVAAIKQSASRHSEFVDSVQYITSNDALCAYFWQTLARIRVRNGSVDPSSTSKFLRAIDARSAVKAPHGYMGQMVYHASTELTYKEILSDVMSLSNLASRLRADLNKSNSEWAVRSYATFISRVPDKSKLVYGGGMNPLLDVGNSSMSQLNMDDVDFGILGKPTLTRRPKLAPVPGLMYIFPPDSGTRILPLLVCLCDNDLQSLRSDGKWCAVAEFVG